MLICLACLLKPGSWNIAMCDDSIVLPSGSMDVMSFEIITGAFVLVAGFSRCIFSPKSAISSVFLL